MCFRYAVRGTRKRFGSPSQSSVSQDSILHQCKSFSDLVTKNVFDILYHLGPHLHTDPVLLCQIVRIGRACFKDLLSSGTMGEDSVSMDALQKVICGKVVNGHFAATWFSCICSYLC